VDHIREWIVKATAAGFLPFELVDPVPDQSRLSGFGGGSDRSLHLEITHVVGGLELAVATATGVPDVHEDLFRRRTVLDAVGSRLDEPLVFPLTLTPIVNERAIEVSVDGTPITFRGIVAVGIDGWTLSARVGLDSTLVTIHGSGDVIPLAIRRRNDLAIDGLPTAE